MHPLSIAHTLGYYYYSLLGVGWAVAQLQTSILPYNWFLSSLFYLTHYNYNTTVTCGYERTIIIVLLWYDHHNQKESSSFNTYDKDIFEFSCGYSK